MVDTRRGVLCGIAAYGLWGVVPLYWPLLKPAGPLEILAHRIMWSLVAVVAVLVVQRRWAWIRGLEPRRLALLALAAGLITTNWGIYIYAVNSGRTIEAALGYFSGPLVSVALGVLVLRERLRAWQWVAVGTGTVAVGVLAVNYGHLPWISLVLAVSFSTYGLVKKAANTESVEGFTVETAVLFLPALAVAAFLPHPTFSGTGHIVLLVSAGPVTAVPLLLFNSAATRVPLSVIGMLQYLTPVLQFLIGLLIQHEAMPASRWAGFVLVWAALVILTTDGLRHARRHAAARPEPAAEAA